MAEGPDWTQQQVDQTRRCLSLGLNEPPRERWKEPTAGYSYSACYYLPFPFQGHTGGGGGGGGGGSANGLA